jgi:acyl-CoA dehydrogenase
VSRTSRWYAAHQLDIGAAHPDEATRTAHQLRGDLLIPIVKGFCTECGIEVASTGIQVHGGMGYIEETGAAQTLRDVRITSIYEGTTGISRTTSSAASSGRDRGATLMAFIDEMENSLTSLSPLHASALHARSAAQDALVRLRKTSESMLKVIGHCAGSRHGRVGAVPEVLRLDHRGWLMARAADVRPAARRGLERSANSSKRNSRPPTSTRRRCCRRCCTLEHVCTQGSDAVSGIDRR